MTRTVHLPQSAEGWGGGQGTGVQRREPPKELWAIARVHKRQYGTKRRKKLGLSVA